MRFWNAIQLMPLGSPPSRDPMNMGTYPTTTIGQIGLTLDKLTLESYHINGTHSFDKFDKLPSYYFS